MPYDPDIHHRRSIRLPGYDYRQDGVYFVTICTHRKQCVLGEVAGDAVVWSPLGIIVAECWTAIPVHFPHVTLDEWVVMPNHVHGLIVIQNGGIRVGAQHAAPLQTPMQSGVMDGAAVITPGSLPAVVRSFKSATTKRINQSHHLPGERFWQRNYYEHVIRDDADLNRIREYIQTNPARWAEDKENPDFKQNRF
jgi:putative transposase